MTPRGPTSPTHKAIRKYYDDRRALETQGVLNEMSVRSPFQSLLTDAARTNGWTLITELSAKTATGRVQPDGTLRDSNSLPRGYWEAKDTKDDLDLEIKRKTARGYKLSNTIFEDTVTAVLFQNKQEVRRYQLGDPKELADLLNQFLSYKEPDIEGFEEAVDEFKERVPELAKGLVGKIQQAHKDNPPFIAAFEKFFDLCRTALNPNIRVEAVDEMLVQHLLTERLFRTIFNNPEFVKRNAIAAEVERVVDALVSKSFDRNEYLKSLDRFYVAIEAAARTLPDFSEKQHFLNTVYERFFQGYSVKLADTHGIVYTPQEIVNFMCASVAEVLETEFGKSLSSKDVYIIDPCTGTGNFVVNLLRRIPKRDLPRVYKEQLFANEVMLLPYYIAALNIEHAYFELTGQYEPFDGLCFVDTLELAEGSQSKLGFMTEDNSRRVERQKKAPITVVIGNPPYNMNQQNENDNNKNRKYTLIDRRVADTYAKDSAATNKGATGDPYVKFFRWALDRLQDRDGIVAFVSNNSFVDQYALDGMRKHFLKDFTTVYHVDLHGNVRRNPKLSGTTHNVFGIRVGVGITVAIRKKGEEKSGLRYLRVPENWRKEEKLGWLAESRTASSVKWSTPNVAPGDPWIPAEHTGEYQRFLPVASKAAKADKQHSGGTIFRTFSVGVKTNRDDVVYDFNRGTLIQRLKQCIENYNSEVDRFKRAGKGKDIDDFVRYENIKWSETLKSHLQRGDYATFDNKKIRSSLYRVFPKKYLFFDRLFNERVYRIPLVFPTVAAEGENFLICCTIDSQMPFSVQMTNVIPSHAPGGRPGQCLPFYVYDEDGTNRRENITDWALEHFRKHYADKKISKWDIFYYAYGILHHPEYRSKYAENLKRELPRIPLAKDFWSFAKAGKELARLHIEYETLKEFKLKFIETPGKPLSYRVGSENEKNTKMRLSKDRKSLKVNDSLTLSGIPAEAFEYRLGNRSALEWVIDQYQVSADKKSGIRSDPNRADDPEYIVRLVGQVIRVSLETVRIVNSLPPI